MAASIAFARCKRNSLFEACLAGNSSAKCKLGELLSNSLRPGVFFIRRFASKVSFPWSQSSTDIYLKDPFLHRVFGSMLLYRALKRVPDGQMNPTEFLNSAKSCIQMVSSLICRMDPDNKLSDILGSRLDKYFKDAFTKIASPHNNLNLHLEVSEISNLRISGIRTAVGPLVPCEDDFLLSWFGQQIFVVPEDMENLRGSNAFSPEKVGNVAKSSFDRGYRFQIGVNFSTQEKFYITEPEGKLLQGSKDFVTSHHMWDFESQFDWQKYHSGEYPLSWGVSDINKFVVWNSPAQRTFASFFTS